MFGKLDEILSRHRLLTEKLADADVLADPASYQKYCKEHADLTETAEAYERYLSVQKEMQDAFALAEEETNTEMKKMLLDEGYDCKEKLAKMTAEASGLKAPPGKGL